MKRLFPLLIVATKVATMSRKLIFLCPVLVLT